jgi:hypothetical protein
MCYPDTDNYITFLFQRLEEFETSLNSTQTQSPGRPKVHLDRSLIVFFAIMTLKAINRFKTQHKWLLANPHWLSMLKLKTSPSRVTLSRRYKQLAPKIEAFVAYLGDWAMPLLSTQTATEVVYEDKSLYKAKGSVWHQKHRKMNHIPQGVRALDTDASWSISKYRGWVYGYALHLTTTSNGFPRLATVYTASVSEKAAIEQKLDWLLARNIRYVIADSGYTDFQRVKRFAEYGILLITPIPGAKRAETVNYLSAINSSEALSAHQNRRKTAIEPVFSLLSVLASTGANQKQLGLSGMENVRTFLILSVMLLQVAMAVNSIWNLPLRNVSSLSAAFR